MQRTYSFNLSHGPFGDGTSSVVELSDDAEARRVGRMLLENAARAKPNPDGLSVLIGIEGGGEPAWLGAWHWDGAPSGSPNLRDP